MSTATNGEYGTDLAPYTVDVNKAPGPDWTHSVAVETIERLRAGGASEKAVDACRFMAIIATGDGGVQVEYHAHGWDVEFNISAEGEPEAFFMDRARKVPIGGGSDA